MEKRRFFRLLTTLGLAGILLVLSITFLGNTAPGLSKGHSPATSEILLEQVLAVAQTTEERQAVAHVFMNWDPQLSEYRTQENTTVMELARGPAEDTGINGTAAHLYFFEVEQRLAPEVQDELDALSQMRTAHLTKVISDTHFEVHYTTTVQLLHPGDHTTDAYAAKVLDYLGKSYDTEITSWGYKAGASKDKAKYQVFIHNLGGAYGSTRDFSINPVTATNAVRTFSTIGIDPGINDDSLLLSTIAHEYHHASQLAYMKITGFKLWILESSTAWLEYQVRKQYPAVVGNGSWNLLKQRMEWFQTHTAYGIKSVNSSGGGGVTNDYDGAIWWWFLVNNTKSGDLSGTGTPRKLNLLFWEKLAEKADWNKIDDAFDDVLVKADYDTMAKAFGHFLNACVLPKEWLPTGTEKIRKAATQAVQLDVIFASDNKKTYTSSSGGSPSKVEPYGMWYFELNPGANMYDIIVEFDGDDNTDFIVKLITLENGVYKSEETLLLDSNRYDESSVWRLDPAKKQTGIVAIGRTSNSRGDYKVTFKTVRKFVFVIDDTGSMGDEINAVKQVAINKVNQMANSSDLWAWSLITFKDYVRVRGTTANSETIKSLINGLGASGGGDCPEESLGALLTVPNVTQPPADAWLFTDASPHGGIFSLQYVISALVAENIHVHPFILGWCQSRGGDICDNNEPQTLAASLAVMAATTPALLTTTGNALLYIQDSVIPLEELARTADMEVAPTSQVPPLETNLPENFRDPEADGTDLYIRFDGYTSEIAQGSDTQYTIYASTNAISATNVVMTLTLPPGVSYLTYTVSYAAQAGGGLTPDIDGNNVVWHLGTLPTPGLGYTYWQQFFYVNAHIATGAITGTYPITVTISTADTETDYNNNMQSGTQHIVEPTRDLYINKTLSSPAYNNIVEDAELQYSINLHNYGNSIAHDVVLTDTLPANTTFITSSNYTSMTVNGQTLVWDLGTLESRTYYPNIYVTAKVNTGTPVGAILTNTVVITTSDRDEGAYMNKDVQVNTTVTPTIDVHINKNLSSPAFNNIIPTADLMYYMEFRNRGNVVVHNVVLTDVLPAETEFITATRTISLNVDSNTLTWDIGDLEPGQYGSFYVYARVLTGTAIGTVITNTAIITTSDVENGTYQNYDYQVNTVVTPTLDHYIYKSAHYPRFFLGENITYTINYANHGNWPAANVRITDTLPQGLTYYSATLEPLQVDGQEIVWEIPLVEAGAAQKTLQLYAKQAGSFALGDAVTNTVVISGTGAYGQVTKEDNLVNNYSEYMIMIGENQDTLWGSMPYVALAEGTGGHYIELSQTSGDYYANVTNASDIVFTEMMRDADLEKQITTITATTKTYNVNVDGYTEQVNFFLNGRPGSNVSMLLKDPSGAVVTESMRLPATQSISYTAAGTSEYYRVYDPTPGIWQAIISGTGTFAFSSSANTSLMMRYLGDTSLPQDIPATVIARLEGEVRTASFSLVDGEGATLQTLQMYDDGLHGDGIGGDGIYGGVWTPVDSAQHYLKATGTDEQGYTFERIDPTPIRIQSMYIEASPDLTAEPGDIINYTFTIHNNGENDDTYYMVYKSTQEWADISGVNITVDVPAGGIHSMRIPVHVPSDAAIGDYDRLRVLAISKNTPELNDKDEAFTIVGSTIDLATAQLVNATWITMPCEQLPCPPPLLVEPPEPVAPINGIVTYTLLYTNTGTSAARNLILTDTLPHAVEYLSDTLGGPDSEPTPGTLVWELSELLGGNSNVITVWGRVTPDAHQEEVLTNTVEIMSTTPETDTQNNQSWSAFTVRGRIPLAPDEVVIDGPAMGTLDVDLEFTAQIKPAITDTLPITYTWEATGKTPQTHISSLTEDGLEDTITYQWSTTGTKQITVTAANALGEVRDVHTIKIVEALPPGIVVITGPVAGSVSTVYTFTAHVGENTVTIPLTYTWEATDHSQVTKQNTTLTATMVYSWSTEGQKTITVTAGNVMGVVKDNHTIDITISGYNIYLPLLMREE